jgi:hypothetical protein
MQTHPVHWYSSHLQCSCLRAYVDCMQPGLLALALTHCVPVPDNDGGGILGDIRSSDGLLR